MGNLFISDSMEISILGEESADEAIEIFIGSTFPGVVGVGKECPNAKCGFKLPIAEILETITLRANRSFSTSRWLRLKRQYSQTARLMISPEDQCQSVINTINCLSR